MTPAARYAAAIEVLDTIGADTPAEKALTNWARRNRYAGSKDRAAVRDHVFEVLRKRRSCAAFGGGESGRALVLGLLRQNGDDPGQVFTSEGYAPPRMTSDEQSYQPSSLTEAEAHDLPDWAWVLWQEALGKEASAAAMSQRVRANVALRVNTAKGTVAEAIELLAGDDIGAIQHGTVASCLIVETNPRRLAQSAAYLSGVVEIQDASSQTAVAAWPLTRGSRVLDYCAGGGGKALAMAAMHGVNVSAHDVDPKRMKDIPTRAIRAGVEIPVLNSEDLDAAGMFDAVLCDAPCSGSGTWRRTPDAKWRLTENDVVAYQSIQLDVLDQAKRFVIARGALIYATCSVFEAENDGVVRAFLAKNTNFLIESNRLQTPSASNDGFYYCVLKKD